MSLQIQEFFEREVDDMIADILYALAFYDDVMIWGKTKEEHDF